MKVDGEQRGLEEKFSNGLLYPGDPDGPAAEVVNCRCALLQKAKWNLDAEETKNLGNVCEMPERRRKEIAKKLRIPVNELEKYSQQVVPIKAKNYKEFKKRYKELWQYEGSELQKQAEERIAGYKKNKVKNSNKGLAAKINGDGIPEHEEAKLLKTINYSDKKVVMKEINSFEASAIKESIEMACVITSDGEVYQCFGVEDGVFPDFDLKEKLYGATISHNHPIAETAYSFSDVDLQLFMDYNLEILRGCDEIYTYEFTRDSKAIDEQTEEWFTEENYQHCAIINKAIQYGIGYRRWKNE